MSDSEDSNISTESRPNRVESWGEYTDTSDPFSYSWMGRNREGSSRWKTNMKETESLSTAIRRWYIKDRWLMGPIGTKEPTAPSEPQEYDHARQFTCRLPMDGIEIGFYELVVCVSLKDTNVEAIKNIIFVGCPGDKNEKEPISMTLPGTTFVEPEEIRRLPKDDFARLRLHRSICHGSAIEDQFFAISFDLEKKCHPFSFEVHYIEIQANRFQSSAETKDHIVYGVYRPDLVIRLQADDKPVKNPVDIRAYNFSDTGEHAVTLSFTDGHAHVCVWDLRTLESKQEPLTEPQILSRASAQAVFEVSTALTSSAFWRTANMEISISGAGSQVALCTPYMDTDGGIPFRTFKWAALAPIDNAASQPWALVESTTICDGKQFSTMCYHRIDLNDDDGNDERFWAATLYSFTIYSTEGNWTCLHTISFQTQYSWSNVIRISCGLQRRYFPLSGADGTFSIWDFETGKVVSHIFTGHSIISSAGTLSSDGSKFALPVQGAIEIWDTFSGIKLAVFRRCLERHAGTVVFGQDYLIADDNSTAEALHDSKQRRMNVIRVQDFSIVKSMTMHLDYSFQYPQTRRDPIFAHNRGANLNIIRPGLIVSPKTNAGCGSNGACPRESVEFFSISAGLEREVQSKDGTKFKLICNLVEHLGLPCKILDVVVVGKDNSSVKSMSIPLIANITGSFGFFIPATSQLGIGFHIYLQIWTLSARRPLVCEISTVLMFQNEPKELGQQGGICERRILSAEACQHGNNIKIRLSPAKWYRIRIELTEHAGEQHEDTLTFPYSPEEDTLKATVECRVTYGLALCLTIYGYGSGDCKQAVIRYLRTWVRPGSISPYSSLAVLAGGWKHNERHIFDPMISELLPLDQVTWIPDANIDKDSEPLALILAMAKVHSSALRSAKHIMDYCVSHAIRSRNLSFLSPFFRSMREVMDLFPDEAFERLNQIAFIPVMSRSYIIDNHRVIHPPSFRLRFWKPSTQPLYKLPDPILQLQVPSKTTNPHIERFRLPLFMASFDALWHYKDGKVYLGTNSNSAAGASEPLPTTWWKTLYHILRLKASPKSHLFVECYDFNLEFYDNPAIAALVAYKWNTIGFWYWVVRFFSQCCFYALVIIASIMQVYYPEPSKLVGVFVAIIAMSTIFLWFELVQATRSWIQYKKSKYNALDIVTFVLPMAASIDQLVVIFENDSKGNNRALSFSVLAVFLHLLIELRINETVCKYVTIIQEAVFQIRVFFFIFAGGILAFTITILHLLRSCPFEGCDAPTTNYSGHFLGALSATYFFMGGRWDPVSDEFDSHDWAFHLAMVMFFFFTVILMLNVLIALINVAFIKGDDSWRLVWIDSRLRCIESAENLSYHIPGFRQTYDWFPKEIYFAASPKQVREYREKYSANGKSTQDSVILEEWMRAVRNDDDYLQDDDNDDEEIEESAKSSRHEESHEVEDGETLDKGKSKFSDDSDDEVERWRFNNEEANELEEVEADDIEPVASGGRVTELGPADTYVNEQETAGTDANGQEIADKDVTATNPERNIEMSDSFSRMDTDMSTVVQLQTQLVDLKAQVEALEKTLAEQLSTQQKTLEEKLLQQLAAQQKQSQQQQLEMQQEHSKRLLEELKTLLQPSPGP